MSGRRKPSSKIAKRRFGAPKVARDMLGLSPSERLGHLVWLLDEVPAEKLGPPALAVAQASFIVVRNMMGQKSETEAVAALDGARELVQQALRAPEEKS